MRGLVPWWASFLILWLGWCPRCMGQFPRLIDTVYVKDTVYALPANALGITFCDANGEVRSFADVGLDAATLGKIIVHEAKHREQSKRFKSCKAWEELDQHDWNEAAKQESEAYCQSLALSAEADREADRNDYMGRVFNQFHGVVPINVVVADFQSFCPVVRLP